MEKKAPQQSESRDADKYIVRFPDGMRARIAAVAKDNGRSMNSEIVARIQDSFESNGGDILSPHMRRSIEEIAKERGVSFAEALSRTLQAGLEPGAPFVAYIKVDSKMTMDELHKIFDVAKQHIPENATVVLESNAA